MPAKHELISLRNAVESDANFIFSTWLKGLRFGNDWFNLIDSKIYYEVYRKVIALILGKPNITIAVACLKDSPNVVLGYAVYSGSRLDWVHVKKAWRGIGIAKMLVPKDIASVSHLTKVGRSILEKKNGVIFNPFNLD